MDRQKIIKEILDYEFMYLKSKGKSEEMIEHYLGGRIFDLNELRDDLLWEEYKDMYK